MINITHMIFSADTLERGAKAVFFLEFVCFCGKDFIARFAFLLLHSAH